MHGLTPRPWVVAGLKFVSVLLRKWNLMSLRPRILPLPLASPGRSLMQALRNLVPAMDLVPPQLIGFNGSHT